jgi:hypothetical protein
MIDVDATQHYAAAIRAAKRALVAALQAQDVKAREAATQTLEVQIAAARRRGVLMPALERVMVAS